MAHILSSHPSGRSHDGSPKREETTPPPVFGGELTTLTEVQFRDLDKLDIVGIYPDYQSALAAWKSKAQLTVDNAHMRYFIVHMHRLLDRAPSDAIGGADGPYAGRCGRFRPS